MLAGGGDKLYAQGCLELFVSMGGTLLVALDGTDSFSSERLSCPCCTRQTLKNGKTLYRHTVVTPIIGEKSFVAISVTENCILGVATAENAGEIAFTKAYGVFAEEVKCIEPDYEPETVNTY